LATSPSASEATHGGARLIKPPLTKPYRSPKMKIPAVEGCISRGSQMARVKTPERSVTMVRVLKTPNLSEMAPGIMRPKAEPALRQL